MGNDVDVDVRMRGFSRRMEVAAARSLILSRCSPLEPCPVPLAEAWDRVLAVDVVAPRDVPPFRRAAMDGYALRAEETFGASSYSPIEFHLVGESLPGAAFEGSVGTGEAVRIMTGAPVPDGANAVVMAEYARETDDRVAVMEPVPPGKNVSEPGEDIRKGTVVLKAGRRLRPQDVGVLSSLGISEVLVHRRPRVRLVITGNELLPAGSEPMGHKIVDANSVILDALVRRDGGVPDMPGIVPDNRDAIEQAIVQNDADVILVSGGTSVGREDHAPLIVASRGELLVHGVAMRPSSPTGFGVVEGKLVFLLPGNPVSCLAAYDIFAGPAIRRMGGRSTRLPYATCKLPLARKITSALGRLDYVRVKVEEGKVEPIATSGASILSSAVFADGFVLVPPDSEGFPPGEDVLVYLYDPTPLPAADNE